MGRTIVAAIAAILLLAGVAAAGDTLILVDGAVVCATPEGLVRWNKAAQPTRLTMLDARDCRYNFRNQPVEVLSVRFFFGGVKIDYEGEIVYTAKESLRRLPQ
jgi:hypothetical protein